MLFRSVDTKVRSKKINLTEGAPPPRRPVRSSSGWAFIVGLGVHAPSENERPIRRRTPDPTTWTPRIKSAHSSGIVSGNICPVPAIGLGNDVACLCDMRIASEKAIFGATFLKIGLIPGDGGAWLLPRIIGGARAAELLFTGKTISADEALGWGLVSQVVSDDKLLETAHDMAHQVAGQSAEALRAAKRLMRHGQNSSFEAVMEMSANAQALMHLSEDHNEAVSAMLEKRPAEYQDK